MFDISQQPIELIAPTLILLIGVIDDLRSKKIHNKLVIVLLALAAIYQFVFFGSEGLLSGLMGSGLAFLILIPLFIGRVLGGGDVKLMLAFGMSTDWANVLWTSIYSLVWAAVFGLAFAIFHKKLLGVLVNIMDIIKLKKPADESTLKIPYSIALFMGWLQQIVFVFVIEAPK